MARQINLTITQLMETMYPGLNVQATFECVCIIEGDDVLISSVTAIGASFEDGATHKSLPVFSDNSMNKEENQFMGIVREKAREVAYRSQKNETSK